MTEQSNCVTNNEAILLKGVYGKGADLNDLGMSGIYKTKGKRGCT